MSYKKQFPIAIYKASGGRVKVTVKIDRDTLWLTQAQIAALFDVQRPAITKHLKNIFETGELDGKSVSSIMEHTAEDGKKYQTLFYNLDAIISIGYRVNSRQATQFRIWATKILHQHLIDGYTVNKELLVKNREKFKALQKAVSLLGSLNDRRQLGQDEVASLLFLLSDYAYGLDLLDNYDRQNLKVANVTRKRASGISYQEAVDIVERIRKDLKVSSNLFGRQRDDSLKSSLAAINQTFGGKPLYPTIEEKAAHLLYFLVKNHSFVDGNKRIAAALFLVYMNRNGLLYAASGEKRLADSGLVALTLLIAESRPTEKADIVKLVINLINKNN